MGMVVTQTLFQTRGAGDGFRRFRLGAAGAPLAVLRVDDMVDIQPFATASNWTATIALEKGEPTLYPVPYVRWTRPEAVKAGGACLAARSRPASRCSRGTAPRWNNCCHAPIAACTRPRTTAARASNWRRAPVSARWAESPGARSVGGRRRRSETCENRVPLGSADKPRVVPLGAGGDTERCRFLARCSR